MENNNQNKWIFLILSIPNIGGLLTTIVTFAPASIFYLIFSLVFSPIFILIPSLNESTLLGGLLIFITGILLISMLLLITWWWLNYLEAKIGLAILLPIPFINIPLRWILYPFMLPFFGIRRIYRHFNTKRPEDSGSI